MTGDPDKTEVLADEFLQATKKMSARELALSGAVLDLNDGVIAAIEFLDLLTDEGAANYDASVALVVGEASRILREAFLRAYAAHASFVARVNGPVVH